MVNKKDNLSPEKLKELKKERLESLCMDRYNLLMAFPFVGNIMMRMELVPTRDVTIRTAATNGSKIYFDMDFYDRLTHNERTFVLAHEVFHCVLLHLVRQNARDHDLWNMAIDMEVNYMLKNQRDVVSSGGDCFTPPKFVLLPPKELEGKAAEVIFEWLLKQKKKNNLQQALQQCAGMNGDGSGRNKGSSSSSSSGSSNGQMQNGNKSGKLEGQFDNHTFEGSDGQAEDGKSNWPTDKWGEVGFDDDVDRTIDPDFAEKMRETILSEVQRAQRTQGKIPAGIDGILEKIMKPEIKWQEVLAQFVTSCYNGKRRWLPPARRHVYNGIYLQSRRSERIKVTVAIDTSGSCLGDLPKFFGELISLLTSFGEYELNLICCDAAVDSFEKYSSDNPFPVEDASKIEWSGGGGTSFRPPFEYVKDNSIEQDCFIYFTDSYGDAPEDPPPYPVLWILTKDGNENFCDWGKKIKFKNDSYDND